MWLPVWTLTKKWNNVFLDSVRQQVVSCSAERLTIHSGLRATWWGLRLCSFWPLHLLLLTLDDEMFPLWTDLHLCEDRWHTQVFYFILFFIYIYIFFKNLDIFSWRAQGIKCAHRFISDCLSFLMIFLRWTDFDLLPVRGVCWTRLGISEDVLSERSWRSRSHFCVAGCWLRNLGGLGGFLSRLCRVNFPIHGGSSGG